MINHRLDILTYVYKLDIPRMSGYNVQYVHLIGCGQRVNVPGCGQLVRVNGCGQ